MSNVMKYGKMKITRSKTIGLISTGRTLKHSMIMSMSFPRMRNSKLLRNHLIRSFLFLLFHVFLNFRVKSLVHYNMMVKIDGFKSCCAMILEFGRTGAKMDNFLK